MQQVGELVGRTSVDIDRIMQADHIRNEAMITYVRSLRANYKVALLSNVGHGVMSRLFSAEELEELFDAVVLSSDVGIVKPDPAIFNFTSDKLGVVPEECLMVDDLAVNVEAARSVGMQGVVFASTDQATADIHARLNEK